MSRKPRRHRSWRRRLRAENLETRQLLAANIFHNAAVPEDVNEDGIVSAVDALTIINEMNRQTDDGEGLEIDGGDSMELARGRRTDVNNDGRQSALDALMVINHLSRAPDGIGASPLGPGNGPDQSGPDQSGPDPTTEDPTTDKPTASEQSVDTVLNWNDVFGEVLADSVENQNPGYASRSYAILNLAIFDAVAIASGNSEGTFYDHEGDYEGEIVVSETDISAEMAATGAAYTVLSELYPDQQTQLDAALENSLATLSSSDDSFVSLALGEEVASRILALRVDDGSQTVGEYTYTRRVSLRIERG
ncbi:dockerin type I domain-containing protein [Allorhodopirellula heiligendammensis]|uniref:Dockerin type I repeat protein n=1 Tax=Allorhodopirellula heiligendammensis TaxID=2714739 RepID=A0A5C6BXG0_9BACT|nr:dockerin type I domain-containing protein [Allorhodopirellula heiligendammensis]TWU15494.1 Dockerin type I repeat protein [Allorhodopirellula heiligendammensis]